MGYLPDRKSKTIFITASTILDNGKQRKLVIESKPEFAIMRLDGTTTNYPLAWEKIYEIALKQHAANLLIETQAMQKKNKTRRTKSK
jgi:hypothetical protein